MGNVCVCVCVCVYTSVHVFGGLFTESDNVQRQQQLNEYEMKQRWQDNGLLFTFQTQDGSENKFKIKKPAMINKAASLRVRFPDPRLTQPS